MSDPQFEYVGPKGTRMRCVTCGTTGYPGGSWQEKCREGHPYQCPDCERVFATAQGAAAHQRNVHRADRLEVHEKRAIGMRAYWQRRHEEREIGRAR